MSIRSFGVGLVVLGLAATACSSSGSGNGGSGNGAGAVHSASASATSPAGSSNAGSTAPKGAPFLLGWINQDKPGSVPTYNGTPQAEAAVKYVNAELGGIGGHPLQLVTCSTNGSPESSQSCANTMISKGVKVVTKNFDGGWDAVIGTFETAGVTVLGGEPTAAGEYSAKNAFYYIGSAPTVVPSMAKLSVQNFKAKKVAVLTTSNPIAKSALPLLLGPLKAAGINPTVITAPDDAADYSPYAAAVQQASPDVVDALLTPPQCLPAMKALHGANFTKPVVTTGLCNDPRILAAAGSAANGWSFGIGTPELNVSPKAAASVLYREVWKKYGSGALNQDAVAQLGVLDVVTVAKQLNQLSAGALTAGAAALQAAIRKSMTAPGAKDPIEGTPLQCGKSKILPAICGFSVYFNTQKNGRLVDATGGKPIDGFIG